MLDGLKSWAVHHGAIHAMNHALTKYDGTDWNARYVIGRIYTLGKFDLEHHNDLPMDWDKLGQLKCLAENPGRPARRTAEMILREYIKLFKLSYQIDTYNDTELSSLAYHYLTNLDIDLSPISEDDKFILTMLNNLP